MQRLILMIVMVALVVATPALLPVACGEDPPPGLREPSDPEPPPPPPPEPEEPPPTSGTPPGLREPSDPEPPPPPPEMEEPPPTEEELEALRKALIEMVFEMYDEGVITAAEALELLRLLM